MQKHTENTNKININHLCVKEKEKKWLYINLDHREIILSCHTTVLNEGTGLAVENLFNPAYHVMSL